MVKNPLHGDDGAPTDAWDALMGAEYPDPNLDDPAHNGSGSTTVAVSASGNQLIDGVLRGIRWSGSISYSDPDSAADYGGSYFTDDDGNGVSAQNQGFSQFSAQQLRAVHFALNADIVTQPSGASGFAVEGFTNLTVSYAGTGASTGTIRVANSTDPSGPSNTAYGFYPSTSVLGGDSWYDQSGTNPIVGNYHWATVIHELGHNLGLKHGHETNVFGALPANRDSLEFSVMTYRSFIGDDANGYNNEAFGFPQTYMMADIAALQYMYGADFTSNGGNTIYTWDPNTGQSLVNGVVALNPGANRIFSTIWDGNGVDTYDLSNYTTNLRIDLRPGESSTFSPVQLAYLGGGPNGGYSRGNVFNALQYQNDSRSLIENAIGGSGNDTFIGNSADNAFRGRGGNDTIDGGGGNDSAVFSGLRSAYTLTDLGGGSVRVTGPDGTDTLTSVERLVFDDQTITWPPTGLGNTWHIQGTGDFDGGGFSDILWRNDNGSVVVWEMNGTQVTAQGPVTVGQAAVAPANDWRIQGTGDFDHDGHSDILWRNDNGSVVVWEMNGTQVTTQGPVTVGQAAVAPANAWHIQGTGDFDRDGFSDILWRNDNGSVVVWEMNGEQVRSQAPVTVGQTTVAPDNSWHIQGTGDFDGDGFSDILWRNDNGSVVVWEMNGTQVRSQAPVTVGQTTVAPDNSWHIQGTGDFDHDGHSDILWRNDNATVVVWEMNGTQVVSQGPVTVDQAGAALDSTILSALADADPHLQNGAEAYPSFGDWHLV